MSLSSVTDVQAPKYNAGTTLVNKLNAKTAINVFGGLSPNLLIPRRMKFEKDNVGKLIFFLDKLHFPH